MKNIKRVVNLIEKNFHILILLFSLIAFLNPKLFLWVKTHIPEFLGVIMFGMGITLRFEDFVNVWKHRWAVALGVFLQYSIMPLLAIVISITLGLPKELMIGMIIVGSCPGGTASNVMVYIAGADLALSISMTMISTLLAPLLTPLIIYFILSQKIDVPFAAMVKSVLWIVLFPVILGLFVRRIVHKKFKDLLFVFPSISIIAIALIIGCVVAINNKLLMSFPFLVFIGVLLHNGIGLFMGYMITKVLGFPKMICRTVSIEVGMQNSGLGISLAMKFFSSMSALVGAIFSIWHNLTGIGLAEYWKRRKT
ncbi:bile acid:sodium symporter family protein [bacterium]